MGLTPICRGPTVWHALYCEPASDIDHTLASNFDQRVTQQAIGRIENLRRIPWSGLPADMISKMVNQGCRFTLDGQESTLNESINSQTGRPGVD